MRSPRSFLERIQKKLSVPEKEWEKFKFAIISMGRPQVIQDDDYVVSLADFRPGSNQGKLIHESKELNDKELCTYTRLHFNKLIAHY